MPTVKDVAEKANVSIATVSRVINNLGGYSEATKEKILKIIDEMGYEANALARGLATKSSRVLGVLMPSVVTSVLGEVLNGIEEIAQENGYSVMTCNTGENGVRSLEYLKILASNRVAGIIYISAPFHDECYKVIKSMKLPCILALTISYKYQIPYVKIDERQAAYSATKYLIEKGHKNIALISSKPEDSITGLPRIEGYKQALSDFGLEINNKLIKHGNSSYESGNLCMEQLLDSGEKFTAVFAVSDDMAVGAMNTAHMRNIKVPDEISVIGFDDSPISRMTLPHLTTVAQPLHDIGRRSAEKLLEIIKDNKTVENSILMHKIIERDTVRDLNEN